MKEKIYTIPVNEAFEQNSECPLCILEKSLEHEAVDYTLGAAMMEPDFRIESNKKGFCTIHYSMLFQKPNKLSLALVLDTHLEELRKIFDSYSSDFKSLNNKKSRFSKKSADFNIISQKLSKSENACLICEKIGKTFERYIDVIFYMWQNDESFRNKFTNSKGVCLPHFNRLCSDAFRYMKHSDAVDFCCKLYEKEKKELSRIQEDIHKFTLKFDYRNKDMELGEAADAPQRAIEKITGRITNEPDE